MQLVLVHKWFVSSYERRDIMFIWMASTRSIRYKIYLLLIYTNHYPVIHSVWRQFEASKTNVEHKKENVSGSVTESKWYGKCGIVDGKNIRHNIEWTKAHSLGKCGTALIDCNNFKRFCLQQHIILFTKHKILNTHYKAQPQAIDRFVLLAVCILLFDL